jgi:hypothetical protein
LGDKKSDYYSFDLDFSIGTSAEGADIMMLFLPVDTGFTSSLSPFSSSRGRKIKQDASKSKQ